MHTIIKKDSTDYKKIISGMAKNSPRVIMVRISLHSKLYISNNVFTEDGGYMLVINKKVKGVVTYDMEVTDDVNIVKGIMHRLSPLYPLVTDDEIIKILKELDANREKDEAIVNV